MKKKKIEMNKQCVVCAILNSNNEKEHQIIVGHTSLFSPSSVAFSYTGSNDQPFHGLLERSKHIGDDFNGHTYGSNYTFTSEYDWGTFGIEAGTDLYVSSYNEQIAGKSYRLVTNDSDRKVLQQADEHSYLRFSSKYFLEDKHYKKSGEKFNDPYVKVGLGLEHDSDKGIKGFGGISHRETWHSMFGATNNQYINHFEDRTVVTGEAKLGAESFTPIGKMGFCTLIEGGLSGNTAGTVKLEARIKAAIDSGILGGGTREDPLFVINFDIGTSEPLQQSSSPKAEIDPTYNSLYLTNKNYSYIGDVRSSHASIGMESGNEDIRLNFDVMYEKNQWNDGDLIYLISLKRKF